MYLKTLKAIVGPFLCGGITIPLCVYIVVVKCRAVQLVAYIRTVYAVHVQPLQCLAAFSPGRPRASRV